MSLRTGLVLALTVLLLGAPRISHAAFAVYDDFNTDGPIDSLKWGAWYNPLPSASGGTVTINEAAFRSLTAFPMGSTLRIAVTNIVGSNYLFGSNSTALPSGAATDAMFVRTDTGASFYADGAPVGPASPGSTPGTFDFYFGSANLQIYRNNVLIQSIARPVTFTDNQPFELGEGNGNALDGNQLVIDQVSYQLPVTTGKGISLNFGSDSTVSNPGSQVGANIAGAVPLGNWNDIPIAQQTDLVLKDSNGAATSLNLSTAQTYVSPASAFNGVTATFPGEGDTAMMRSTVYLGPAGTDLDLTFEGGIPYSQFDIYMYYSGDVDNNAITFSILNSSGGSLGLSQVGLEDNDAGINSTFVQSTGAGVAGNYVRFAGLTSAQVPTDFIIRVSGGTAGFNLINGIQIVEVPEPTSLGIAAIGMVGVLVAARRRRR